LIALRGPDESKWHSIFYENLESIAGFAAYLGECIAERAVSTNWYVETTEEIQLYDRLYPSEQFLHFSAQYEDDRERDFDFLEVFLRIWNYSPHVKCRHVNQLIEGIPCCSISDIC